jgi:aryl-alcohol dehydrogenase-like predicted oxidoreductase
MKQRHLGRNGPRVSAIGMGRGSQPVQFDTPLEKEFNATIHCAVDLGITLFDSSDAYWGTRHEVLLGRAIKGRRDKVMVASKFGNIELPDGTKAPNAKPAFVIECCEASLKRLDVDVIDLFYLHRVDPNTPIEDTVGAMARLVEQGKIRHIGVCEVAPETLRRAHKTHPIAALQTEYSLWFRECETEILPLCRELGIAYVGYAPLGRGLLTGRIRTVDDLPPNDRRRRHPRFAPENLARNVELVAQLDAMAKAKGISSAQLALAWLLAQGEDVIPIPGTNHIANLEQNVSAVDVVMTPDEVKRLGDIFAPGVGAGARYTPNALKGVWL